MNAKKDESYSETIFGDVVEERKEPVQIFLEPSLRENLKKLADNETVKMNLSAFVRLALLDFLKTRKVQDRLRRLDGRTRVSKKAKQSQHQKLL